MLRTILKIFGGFVIHNEEDVALNTSYSMLVYVQNNARARDQKLPVPSAAGPPAFKLVEAMAAGKAAQANIKRSTASSSYHDRPLTQNSSTPLPPWAGHRGTMPRRRGDLFRVSFYFVLSVAPGSGTKGPSS